VQTDDINESVLVDLLKALPMNKRPEFLSKMLLKCTLAAFHIIVPDDFLSYTAKAMSQL